METERLTITEWKRILETELQDVKGFRKVIIDFKKDSLKLYFTVLTPSRREEVYKIFENKNALDIPFSFEELR